MAPAGKDRAVIGMGRMEQPTLFDTWLQMRLQRLYDETLSEPLADELLDLLSGNPSD